MQLGQLKNLASESNARLVLMTHDKQDISKIDHYIENNLVVVDDESRPWHDAGYPLVFLVAILFLMWFRRGWTLQW
jgi:Ca-activated chloride channel family protein